ncbi:MAG: hypothetical protein ACLSUW_04860 [Akkermansia sp.]
MVKNQTPDISISWQGNPHGTQANGNARSGFGLVNARYDAKEKNFEMDSLPSPAAQPVTVQVRWKNPAVNMWQTATWQFGIEEQEMHFLPNIVK